MVDKIKIETTIDSQIDKVWEFYTNPEHIKKWNHASDDWHTPRAENDLRVGGKFNFRMESKTESVGFDFSGKYEEVQNEKSLAYQIDDGRKVKINFDKIDDKTRVSVEFEAENENSIEMQKSGWQAILDNFKKYCENN